MVMLGLVEEEEQLRKEKRVEMKQTRTLQTPLQVGGQCESEDDEELGLIATRGVGISVGEVSG